MAGTLRVGRAEIAVAWDAEFRFAPSAFLRDAHGEAIPVEAWRPYLAGRDPAELEESRVLTFVVRSQGKTILVDTGVGPWGLWRFGAGHLLDSLAALDLRPESVDVVLPTHLHLDHIGWNTRPSDNGPVPTFPRARYLFQQLDWEYYTRDEFLRSELPHAQQVRAAVLPLRNTGLMELIGSEASITDEVTLLHTPGHTPGSVSVLVQSGGEAALLLGDVAHHAAQLTETDWSPLIDVDPSLAARSRRAVVQRAAELSAAVAGAHFAASAPAFGRMVPIEGRMVWHGVTLP